MLRAYLPASTFGVPTRFKSAERLEVKRTCQRSHEPLGALANECRNRCECHRADVEEVSLPATSSISHRLANLRPVLHLPGMLEDVPGDPAGCIPGSPAVGHHG